MPRNSYQYSPIDPSVDGIRLLIIEPAKDSSDKDLDAPVSCRIQHVTFGQRPRYEALSYTWGDETIRHKIAIDGYDFYVGQNLFDALRVLRDDSERVLWVDAICINQIDIQERNQQVGIMPFIYLRAKTVLIWLGLLSEASDWEFPESVASDMDVDKRNDDTLCHILASNPYWKRVWIVQEVGLARKRMVCYGTYKMEWSTLIGRLQERPDTEDSLPVKLHEQLAQRYDNTYDLQLLVENYRDSLCKEPRDHIYGFLGLAVDCQNGFPMGYEKSLYEVWKDVIRFKNASNIFGEPREVARCGGGSLSFDILSLGRIVQEILGGPGIATEEEVARDIVSQFEVSQNDVEDWGEILIRGLVAGRIVHLGPTFEQLTSNLESMASWRTSMNRYLLADRQALGREESELFLELLEDAEYEDMNIIGLFDRDIFNPIGQQERHLEGVDRWCRIPDEIDTDIHDDSEQELTDPQLFLLGGGNSSGSGPESCSRIGLAPSTTRVGDYIILVHGIAKVLVVRKEQGWLRIIGTAAIARNSYHAREFQEKGKGMDKVFGINVVEGRGYASWIDLYVDIATAYELVG